MRAATLVLPLLLLPGLASSSSRTSNALLVSVSAPHPGLSARVTATAVTLRSGRVLRRGDGYMIISTPAEVEIAPSADTALFRLEPDTAWVRLVARGGGRTINAEGWNMAVSLHDGRLRVFGIPRTAPGS